MDNFDRDHVWICDKCRHVCPVDLGPGVQHFAGVGTYTMVNGVNVHTYSGHCDGHMREYVEADKP